ncbi:hypothetical protein HYH03_006539 [Edaphochlamys debaryana]|uniref:Uncharacterized protein n=1 Tax=Edaphochlamys debaryana TaxID=47281 RepID=A0A836BZZ5_9CHLO|nr:hypothetical protein HYH03_006539 [Edaphochlamys debaryana]|eukprot:KAG2495266.1 hypothetical protein HYH03_006539 [Edaphochlamys debaryana]
MSGRSTKLGMGRDLAVLLVHAGRLGAARLELRTYLATALPAAAVAAAAEAAAPSASPSVPAASTFSSGTVGSTYASGYGGPDPFDLALCRRLLALLEGLGPELAAAEPAEPLGVEATLRAPPPWERLEAAPRRSLPLTW